MGSNPFQSSHRTMLLHETKACRTVPPSYPCFWEGCRTGKGYSLSQLSCPTLELLESFNAAGVHGLSVQQVRGEVLCGRSKTQLRSHQHQQWLSSGDATIFQKVVEDYLGLKRLRATAVWRHVHSSCVHLGSHPCATTPQRSSSCSQT